MGLTNPPDRVLRSVGDSASEPRFIETFPKRGYRWIAPINSLATHRPQFSQIRWPLAAAFAAAVAVGAILGHEISALPIHDGAVEWVHRVFEVPFGSCPLG